MNSLSLYCDVIRAVYEVISNETQNYSDRICTLWCLKSAFCTLKYTSFVRYEFLKDAFCTLKYTSFVSYECLKNAFCTLKYTSFVSYECLKNVPETSYATVHMSLLCQFVLHLWDFFWDFVIV